MWRWGDNGGGYKTGGNIANRGGNQLGLWKDPNAMDVDRGRKGDKTCYHCGKWGHMTRNYWEKNRVRVVDMLQESAKENEEQ